jgi:hypothetical protein
MRIYSKINIKGKIFFFYNLYTFYAVLPLLPALPPSYPLCCWIFNEIVLFGEWGSEREREHYVNLSRYLSGLYCMTLFHFYYLPFLSQMKIISLAQTYYWKESSESERDFSIEKQWQKRRRRNKKKFNHFYLHLYCSSSRSIQFTLISFFFSFLLSYECNSK